MVVTPDRAAEMRDNRFASKEPVVARLVRRCCLIRVVAAAMAVLVVAACETRSQNSASNSTSASSTTTVNTYWQMNAQGKSRCNQAFAIPPGPAQNPGRAPLTSFEKDDTSGLNGGRLSNGSPNTDWEEVPGLVSMGWTPTTGDPAQLNTIVCVQRSYKIVGDYIDNAGSTSPAARVDLDARLVDWGTGAVLAAQHFQGLDPQQHSVTTNPGSVVAGDEPDPALLDWVKGLASG